MKRTLLIAATILALVACGKPADEDSHEEMASSKGVGPVQSVVIPATIDAALAAKGLQIFEDKCTACHKHGERYVGPDLNGVTERRQPEWIMNMIVNPIEMTQKDPVAKELLGEYLSQMTNQNVNEDDARALLEHFRENDASL